MKLFSTIKNLSFAIFLIFFLSSSAFSQNNENGKIWKTITEKDISFMGQRYTFPVKYNLLKLNIIELKQSLLNAPPENTNTSDLTNGIIFSMPMPDGTFKDFKIVKYNVMHPVLAAKYPDIKTYTGRGITDPSASIKLDLTPGGFHAMVLSPAGNYFIDPFCKNNIVDYISYNKNDLQRRSSFICETKDDIITKNYDEEIHQLAKSSGTQLRTYRLALACTGEYAATKGGTVAGALAAMATSMNRVNGVYETEVGIRMIIVANNDLICFTNATTDPYTNNNGSTMLGQNITTCNNIIGSANYDIGHVFSTGGGGVAYLGVPCNSNKAGGVTGSSNPVGDAYDIDYVAHEMGHQFGANHTFNSTIGSCGGGNRSSSAAYEPGSGVTVMAYAGICGTDDLAPHSIAYFHTKSFDEITTYSQTGGGNTCPVTTNTGNTAPVVNAMVNNYSIPISTPFTVEGSATDADNDPITYSWEEYDLGTSGAWNVQSTTAPMFRSFEPTTSGSRTFPKLSDILNNTTTVGELLPNKARTLKFRLTARDNRSGGGGVMHPDNTLDITVVNNGGAFKVTSPNTALTWAGGSVKNVTWDVSGTTQSPINTASVKISLSTDGGFTFPTVLLESTPNTGSADVTLPNIQTSQARIKVEAVGNIYFDICDKNFTINAVAALSSITTSAISPLTYCSGNSIAVSFTINNNANSGNVFTAELSNSSGSFSNPVIIGTLSSVSQGTINAIIPGSAATGNGYRIRVTSSNPAITGTNNGSNISVGNPPAASVISSNGSTTICQGSSVVLTGNTSGGTWNNGGSTLSSITVNTSGQYFVTNTNTCGSVISNSIIVNVNPLPTVSAGSYGPLQINSPSISLTGTPAGGTFTGTGVNNNTFNPAVAGTGTFTITYTYTNGNGCTNSNTTNIAVTPVPVTTKITTSSISPLSYCSGNNFSVGFTVDNNANSGNIFTAQLSNASGSFSNPVAIGTLSSVSQGSINATIPVSTPAGNGYRIRVVSSNPAITGTNNGANISIGNLAAAPVISASGSTNICQGSNVVLTGNTSGGTWNIGGTASSITVNATGEYFVTKTNSCGSVTSNHITVVVNPLPSVSAGTYGTLQINSPAISLTGTPAGGTFTGTGVNNNFFNPGLAGVGTFNVTYTYTNGNGCTNNAVTQIKVEAGECLLTIESINGPSSACESIDPLGGNATYTVSTTNASTFTWTVPANSVIVSGQGTSSIEVDFLPSFVSGYLGVKVGSACGGASVTKKMSVNKALPSTPGVITGPDNACAFFGSDVAIYSIKKVLNAASYNWIVPTGAIITSHPNGQGENDTIIKVSFNSSFVSGSVISVAAASYCGQSSKRAITVKTSSASTPISIYGPSDLCNAASTGILVEYNIKRISSALKYNWTVSGNATIVSHPGVEGTDMDTSILVRVNPGFTTGSVRVTSFNGCTTSSERLLILNIKLPSTPLKIYGSPNIITGEADAPVENVCEAVFNGTYLTYSINKVKVETDDSGFASGYNWEISDNVNTQVVHPNGAGINDTIINIYFNQTFSTASLTVSSTRACGSSTSKRIIILSKKIPKAPSPISGQNTVCPGSTYTYSVIGNGQDNFTWLVPSGAEILSGQGTNSITVLFTSSYLGGGTLKVNSTTTCGNSGITSMRLTKCTSPQKPLITSKESDADYDITIYPNPSRGLINLNFKNIKNVSKGFFTITTVSGKVIFNSSLNINDGVMRMNLTGKIIPGVYILKSIINGKVITKKIIIQ